MQALCLLWQLPVLRQELLPENTFRKEDSRFILFFYISVNETFIT
jgi:hypothetical protein